MSCLSNEESKAPFRTLTGKCLVYQDVLPDHTDETALSKIQLKANNFIILTLNHKLFIEEVLGIFRLFGLSLFELFI